MKSYVKPTVEVVELSVRESMADLPAAIEGTLDYADGKIHLTTYNLAAVSTSENA